MKIFRFPVICEFEITVEEATAILADPSPVLALDLWLVKQHPTPNKNVKLYGPGEDDVNTPDLRRKLGEHQVAKLIAERKQLGNGVIETYPVGEEKVIA